MSIPLSIDETEEARLAIEGGSFLFKLSVEFGSDFHEGRNMTRQQLLDKLNEEAGKHNGFSAEVFKHIAEHMELDHSIRMVADESAKMNFVSGYRGCGSCNPGGGNMGQVCFWDDGTSSCEIC